MKILAVDDRSDDLYLLRKILEGKGFTVSAATNGKEALDKIHDAIPDLVISDILMPVMDGYQLLKEVKSEEKMREIPFVFYTATYTSKKDEEFAYSLGASRFIVKPQEPDSFINIINKTIQDQKEGILTPSEPKIRDDKVYLKEYNERLVQKLEDKVTELAVAHDEIGRSMDFLEALVNSMKDGVVYIDPTGIVKLTNQSGKKLQKELLKKILPEIVSKGECNCDGDLFFDGVYYDVSCSSVTTHNGRFLGTTLVLRDVTDRRMFQEELKSRVAELEKWQRLTVGREIKMIELKKRVKELEDQLKGRRK